MVATELNLTSGTEIVASPNAADAKRRRVSGEVATNFFSGLPGPEDPILGLRDRYIADPHPSKLSVAVGAYRTEEGKPLVLECVREAEAALDDFNAVISINPRNAHAFFRRAFAHKALGQYEDAADDFEKARELDPENPALAINYRNIGDVQCIVLCDAGLEPVY